MWGRHLCLPSAGWEARATCSVIHNPLDELGFDLLIIILADQVFFMLLLDLEQFIFGIFQGSQLYEVIN